MRDIFDILKHLSILLMGFVLISLGMVLTKRADLGMSAWGVFHQGLAKQLGLSFGVVTILLGLIILTFSIWLLKVKAGIGTILNVLVIGVVIDIFDYFITFIPSTMTERTVLLIVGLVIMTFGRALYISAALGEGPRDGLMIGLHKLLNIEIKYLKPTIEATVLLLGYLFGGTVGVGTIVIILASGYLVQLSFKLLHYDPKASKQKELFLKRTNKEKGTN